MDINIKDIQSKIKVISILDVINGIIGILSEINVDLNSKISETIIIKIDKIIIGFIKFNIFIIYDTTNHCFS